METTSLKLQTLNYSNVKTYLVASIFIAGNLVLPQLCHLVPSGGLILLPIYFFTLIGAFKYGWKAGLLIAVLSPVINSLLFAMPPMAVLPAILVKSVLLAVAAGFAANYFKRITIPVLIMVVLFYQVAGTMIEWMLVKDFMLAVQDFRIAIPGMLLQVFGGYFILKSIAKR